MDSFFSHYELLLCNSEDFSLLRNVMKNFVLKLTRMSWIPLNFRRKLGNLFLSTSDHRFFIERDGLCLQGTLDNYIDRIVFITGNFFEYTYLNLFKKLLGDQRGCALDIGANVGNHSIHFSTYFDQVCSFEPFPPIYKELAERTKDISNIEVHQVALSDSSGTLRFSSPGGSNLGTGKISDAGDIEVSVTSGDSAVADYCRFPVRFIKIDTEGHELKVLDGLQETIKRDRPVIVFEIPSNTSMSRAEGFRFASEKIPGDYRFYGIKSQSTFPFQRTTAKYYPIDLAHFSRRFRLVLALPSS